MTSFRHRSRRAPALSLGLLSLSLLLSACQSERPGELLPGLEPSAEGSSITVTARVAASYDDAEETAAGRVDRTSTDLELTTDGSVQTVGLRFRSVAVPRGATVVGAYVVFRTDEVTSGATPLTIRGQAADHARVFSATSKNVSSRPRTVASAVWSPPSWTRVAEAGLKQRTPNLAPIVQEIVDRSGWISGNALALTITGQGKRVARSFDGDRAGAPVLRLTYTLPAPIAPVPVANQPPVVVVPGDLSVTLPAAGVLSAQVTDDGLPDNTLGVRWSQVSGPGAVTFTDGSAHQTTANFSQAGSYRLRVEAHDGVLAAGQELNVTVLAATDNSVTPSVTVVAAGDIACSPGSPYFNGGQGTADLCRQRYTAELIGQLGADAVLTLGDNQYEDATFDRFMGSYDLSWGLYKSLTYPAPGNHEYRVLGAADYFRYFGARAGDPSRGYYSFDLGGWHLIALNSNCAAVGGCGAGSPQERWLRADLAANPSRCTLAYWHHPLFSSGKHGDNPDTTAFWEALYEAGAELVLAGHDHNYERFAPQTAAGVADPERGIRQFVVGTGGKNHYAVPTSQPRSEVANGDTHGVLELKLGSAGYDWRFVPEAGGTFSDLGSGSCR